MLRRRLYDALDKEVTSHLEQRVEELVASGVPKKEADAIAHREFGNVGLAKETAREVWGWRWAEDFFRDLQFAVRLLRKNPGFTLACVLTLALGIGANTAIFSLINAVMLRTLPVQEPGQLVELLHRFPGEPALNGFPNENFQLLRDGNRVFSGLIAATNQSFEIREKGYEPQAFVGGYVDGNYFQILGLRPTIGRLIDTQDDRIASPSAVVVLSWSFWKSKFNSDRGIVGKPIFVNNVAVTVVGVAPKDFTGLSHEAGQALWLPLSMQPVISRSVLGWGSLSLVGRLKDHVSFEQAQAEMAVLFSAEIQAPSGNPFIRQMKFEMRQAGTGLSSPLRQKYSEPLQMLMALVVLLLLIASTNVASLLLARGTARLYEIGVRISLGAGRLRLVRQVLTESLLLSVVGALVGAALAYYGVNGLMRIINSGRLVSGAPSNFRLDAAPDLHVLFFTGGITLLAGLLSGIAPIMRAVVVVPLAALRPSGQAGKPAFRLRFGKSLVVTQVSLSLVLLCMSAVFVNYLRNLEHLDLGFRRDHLLLVSLDPYNSGLKPEQLLQMSQPLLQQLESIAGVQSATLSSVTPISGNGQSCYCVNVEGHEEPIGSHHTLTSINRVAGNYFEIYGIPLLAGRTFSPFDQRGPRVAIINQTMAHDYFGDLSPIGKHFSFDLDANRYEIVGVTAVAKYDEIREDSRRTIYLDVFEERHFFTELTIRTSVDAVSVAPQVRSVVANALRAVPVTHVTTMTDQVDASIVPERLIATLSGWFGALGAVLAAIGLYGLLSFTVACRTNEIGIRMALGAPRSNVTWMVLEDALWIVAGGAAIGLPATFWAQKLALSLVRDVPTNNALAIILSVLTMFAVTLVATWLPARRAARVDPMVALRYE